MAIRKTKLCALAALLAFHAVASPSVAQVEKRLQLHHTEALPKVKVDGHDALIHSQGLYVTDRYAYVTGRLEGKDRRALFVQCDRKTPGRYKVLTLDLQPDNNDSRSPIRTKRLDHPGGFDFDGREFWIPVARSIPLGPTLIVRITPSQDVAFDQWRCRPAFLVADHIGALAIVGNGQGLLGANWDTEKIYFWGKTDGRQIARRESSTWLDGEPWGLAVQDWKRLPEEIFGKSELVIAGGIDKSGDAPDASVAVVDIIAPDSEARRRVARFRLPEIDGLEKPLTNEGLCIYKHWLVLCPSDLGTDARLYFFDIAQ